MSKKRSDALTALVREVVDIDVEITDARQEEEGTNREYVAAHETWQLAAKRRIDLESRLKETGRALAIIASRDDIADEVIEALKKAAAR